MMMRNQEKTSGKGSAQTCSNKLRGKKNLKQDNKGMQTISAMFKRQEMALMSEKGDISDDVSLVGVSSDFQSNMDVTSHKKRKLSLKSKSPTPKLQLHDKGRPTFIDKAEETNLLTWDIQVEKSTSPSKRNINMVDSALNTSKNIQHKNRLSLRKKKGKSDQVIAIQDCQKCTDSCSVVPKLTGMPSLFLSSHTTGNLQVQHQQKALKKKSEKLDMESISNNTTVNMDNQLVLSDEKTHVESDDKTNIVKSDDKTHNIMSDDKMQEVVPGDEKDEVVPGDEKDEVVPGDEKDEVVPGDQKDEVVPGDQKDEVVPGDQKDEVIAGNPAHQVPISKRKHKLVLSDKLDEPEVVTMEETDETEAGSETQYAPYYLQNFSNIIHTVLADEDNVRLFSEQDLNYVATFDELPETGQKLYVRLFCRKVSWLPLSRLKYIEIASDLADTIHQLIAKDFLITDEKIEDLQETLTFLSSPDLKTIAKSFHVKSSGLNKSQIIQSLLKKSRDCTVGSMFKMADSGMQQTMMKRAKALLGKCVKLTSNQRGVFIRLLMLYSLVNTGTDDETGSGGQSQIFQMLQVNMGKVVYPTYNISKKTAIFQNRESVVEFEKALQYESNLNLHIERNEYQKAYDLYQQIKGHWEQLGTVNANWDKNLPSFLRRYTAGHVYIRLLRYGIDIIQRRKDYTQAVDLLRHMLSNNIYGSDHRGYYWDRLALNLDTHLKSTKESLKAAESGLSDPCVKGSYRLSLYQRALKICKSAKWKSHMSRFQHDVVTDAPECYVDGKVLSHTVPGARFKFMLEDEEETVPGDVTLCSVEELALQYYRHNGFSQGVHAEGSIIGVLFCLYFWDIMFMDVPDSFHSPFQTCPLDIDTEMFYVHRQQEIEEQLLKIKNSTDEVLQSLISSTWEKENGKMCSKMNWEKFSSEQLQGLVVCMGGNIIAGILERYVKNPRHTRSGFPDLTVWNLEKKKLKISEVKGPGDRLSNKQILWLDFLLKLGVDAEVCYVRAVGAKRLKLPCN